MLRLSRKGNKLDLHFHAHPLCETLQCPQRRICTAGFQFADVGLCDASLVGKLFLCQTGRLARVDHGLNDRKLWLQRIVFRFQRRVFELRAKVGSDITRVLYFFMVGKRVILTNGFVKKTVKTPPAEIARAKRYRAEYLGRKDGQHE